MDDATVPGWSFRYGSGGDPAHDASPWVWMRAPWELQARWSTRFSFDDPNFQWLYVRVGYDQDVNRCEPPAEINPARRGDTYIVAGLAPYAAYRVLSVSTEGSYLRMRVRYWVGLMNHFSYFQPPQRVGGGTAGAGALGGIDTSRGRWDVRDLDASVWNGDRVNPRGTFAEYWTSLIDHLELSIAWADPGGVDRGEYKVLYSCDPTDNLRAGPFAKYATRTNGLPTSFCFSDGDSLATQQMTSFLGISTWGEACVCVPIGDLGGDGGTEPGSALDTGIVGAGVGYGASGSDSIVSRRRAAVARGFERVFGAQVRVGARIAFWSPDGGVTSEQPHSVERYMVVSSADLETVDEVVGRIDALRNRTTGSPANRWLLREFDLSRLEAAADGAEAFAVPCELG